MYLDLLPEEKPSSLIYYSQHRGASTAHIVPLALILCKTVSGIMNAHFEKYPKITSITTFNKSILGSFGRTGRYTYEIRANTLLPLRPSSDDLRKNFPAFLCCIFNFFRVILAATQSADNRHLVLFVLNNDSRSSLY